MAIFGALAIWLGLGPALAQERYRDPNTAEGWALPQIERSEMADFNERCNTPALDPNDEQDARAGATTAARSPPASCRTC
jgi:hypothetical protein